MGEAGRARVVERYAVERLVDDVDPLYRTLLRRDGALSPREVDERVQGRLVLPRHGISPDCQPPRFGSSLIRNQSIMSMRGFLRAIAKACFRYAACFAQRRRSVVGRIGLVAVLGDPDLLRPVELRDLGDQHADVAELDAPRRSCRSARTTATRVAARVVRVVRLHVERLHPGLLRGLRNESGSTEGRDVVGASLPFGAVTPHATCSPGGAARRGRPRRRRCRSSRTGSALSTTHLPPLRSYCGVRKTGLFGSFHAVQSFTAGSGSVGLSSVGCCCQSAACRSRCSARRRVREVPQIVRVRRRDRSRLPAVRPAGREEDREDDLDVVRRRVAHETVVERPVVGGISRVGRVGRLRASRHRPFRPAPVEVHAEHLAR